MEIPDNTFLLSVGEGMHSAEAWNSGASRLLTRQQIDHARKLIDDGQRRVDVAALLNVNRTTFTGR